jgi:hypothetical protein
VSGKKGSNQLYFTSIHKIINMCGFCLPNRFLNIMTSGIKRRRENVSGCNSSTAGKSTWREKSE